MASVCVCVCCRSLWSWRGVSRRGMGEGIIVVKSGTLVVEERYLELCAWRSDTPDGDTRGCPRAKGNCAC